MMVPSDRFKHAFKVALAMAITYGIALAMDWEKPFWAGLSVAFCSLATTGESINRGVYRVLGTFLAGVAAVTMAALFPQDRWPFLLLMSGFIALCTYWMSMGSRSWYIWLNAGFNLPIVAMLGGNVGLNSFDVIVLRVQETTLGVVVYSLVAVLLWPRSGKTDLEGAVQTVCKAQHGLFSQYFRMMTGNPDAGDLEPLRAQIAGQLPGLRDRLEGAVTASYEVWEVRHAWRRCISQLAGLGQALERWRLGFNEVRAVDLHQFIPGLGAFGAELEARFAAIDGMQAGQAPLQQPRTLELKLERDKLRTLSHFERAAVVLCRDQLVQLDRLTRELFDTISDIRGYGRAEAPTRVAPGKPPALVIDPDRLAVTVRQSAALWLTLLAVIYIPAFPNPVGVVALANAFAMAFSLAPHLPAGVLLLPTLLGAAFAGGLYMFLMPNLSGFGQLGVMIFAASFAICYVYHRPQAALARMMGLCMLVIVIGVENQQTYTFLYFANWFICGILFVLALMLAWRFPISFRPEDRFLKMLARFFRSAEFLVSRTGGDDDSRWTSWLSRQRRAFHLHEVTVLPQRLRAWGRALPPAALGNTSRDEVQSLLTSLQALSDRMQALLEAQPAARSEILVRELLADMQDWRTGILQGFGRLQADPGTVDPSAFGARVDARLAHLEARVEEALDQADEARVSSEARANLYRLLGAYRGLSEALVDLAQRITSIDWARLREARF